MNDTNPTKQTQVPNSVSAQSGQQTAATYPYWNYNYTSTSYADYYNNWYQYNQQNQQTVANNVNQTPATNPQTASVNTNSNGQTSPTQTNPSTTTLGQTTYASNYYYPYNYYTQGYNYSATGYPTTTPAVTSATSTPQASSANYFQYTYPQTQYGSQQKPEYLTVKAATQPTPAPKPVSFQLPAKKKIPQFSPSQQLSDNGADMDTSDDTTKASASLTSVEGSSQIEWPPSLQGYVARAFAQCKTDAARNEVESQLKIIIRDAVASKKLHTLDWALYPLPKISSVPIPEKPKPEKTNKRLLPLPENESKKKQREKRFTSDFQITKGYSGTTSYTPASNNDDREIDWDAFLIKGTSQELEKQYLRLTSAPDPSTVRPEPVLKKSLQMLKSKWSISHDYTYTCEQLKSIRQDLTVQRIKNEFTVEVYETHARWALENWDLGEFNQCQTQLKSLYLEGIKGNVAEFIAYRLLYFIFQGSQSDIAKLLFELSVTTLGRHKNDEAISHALKVREVVVLKNYHAFFKLCKSAPNCGKFFMSKLAVEQRKNALQAISKAFRGDLPTEWLQSELGFDDKEQCQQYLKENNFAVQTLNDNKGKTK